MVETTATGTITTSGGVKTNLSIADAEGSEGENITFKVTSNPTIAEPINFSYTVDFAGQTASANDLSGGQLTPTGGGTIAANDSSTTISIPIFDDNLREDAETFLVIFSSDPDDVAFTNHRVTGTIIKNDATGIIAISVLDATGDEGENITFKVTSGGLVTEAISFSYTVDFAGQTNPANASDLTGGQLTPIGNGTIATNDSSTTISIATENDTLTEPDETFRITISNLPPNSNTTFDNSVAIGTILASDPQIRIADATSSGESKITFNVTSTQPFAKPISFSYNLNFDNPLTLSSASISDFSVGETSGNETITAGQSSTTIEIDLVDDEFKESNETFQIQLSNLTPPEATFANPTATGTIASSDSEGVKTRISIAEAQGREGQNIIFTVTATPPIAEQTSFQYEATLDNTTTANIADLTGDTSGQITLAANNTSTTIEIEIFDDNSREEAETFLVILSQLTPPDATFGDNVAIGTILANDDDSKPRVSIATLNLSVTEGSDAIFKVSIDSEVNYDYTFQYTVTAASSSATNGDFENITLGTPKTATISANDSSTAIIIRTVDDTEEELSEIFIVSISANVDSVDTVNIHQTKNTARATIIDNDLKEVSNVTFTIGNGQITLNWINPANFSSIIIGQANISTRPPRTCRGSNTIFYPRRAESIVLTHLTNGRPYSFRICVIGYGTSSRGVTLSGLVPSNDIDVDDDNDGLIEITNATEFNNIRYNLAGTSYRTSTTPSNNPTGDTIGCPASGCNGYELTANIDLSGYTNWDPIGSDSDEFTAIFDGNNRTISNLTITGSNSYVGLFAALENATIRNLKLTDVSINASSYTGALAGQAVSSTLSNIELIGDESQTEITITRDEDHVGGLVGDFSSGTIIAMSLALWIL